MGSICGATFFISKKLVCSERASDKALETLLDKVRYLSYNKPSDKFYFRVGNMPSTTLGYGILVNNYSNTIEYPIVIDPYFCFLIPYCNRD